MRAERFPVVRTASTVRAYASDVQRRARFCEELEIDQAFTPIVDEHRINAQIHVALSPRAHLAIAAAWRESLWVDLGIGWCGLTAFRPCGNRLACLPCPNFIEKHEQLPVFQEQPRNLIELHMLGSQHLPADRKDEITSAVEVFDQRVVPMNGMRRLVPSTPQLDID